jgi:hypothetical protein
MTNGPLIREEGSPPVTEIPNYVFQIEAKVACWLRLIALDDHAAATSILWVLWIFVSRHDASSMHCSCNAISPSYTISFRSSLPGASPGEAEPSLVRSSLPKILAPF